MRTVTKAVKLYDCLVKPIFMISQSSQLGAVCVADGLDGTIEIAACQTGPSSEWSGCIMSPSKTKLSSIPWPGDGPARSNVQRCHPLELTGKMISNRLPFQDRILPA